MSPRILCFWSVFACALAACQAPGATSELDTLLANHAIEPIVGEFSPPPRRADHDTAFSFLVAGHLYGAPGPENAHTGPAHSFAARTGELGASGASFFVSLGDFVRGFSEKFVPPTVAALEGLGLPVFNAVGNHDTAHSHATYSKYFGRTWGGFRRGSSLFLVLDTEATPWLIQGEQLRFLRAALAAAPAAGIERVFLFAHRVLFATDDERYRVVFRHCNSKQSWPGSSNFQSDVRPLLAEFALRGDVIWFSGDIGVRWSYGLFHDFDERIGVRYVGVGLGECDWDSVVSVRVGESGSVELERIALTDTPPPALEQCGIELWEERFPSRPRRQR